MPVFATSAIFGVFAVPAISGIYHWNLPAGQYLSQPCNKPPSVHVLGDFNFSDIVWPDRLNKSGSTLSPSEGEKFIEILNDHHLEQLVNFLTRGRNTLDILKSLG